MTKKKASSMSVGQELNKKREKSAVKKSAVPVQKTLDSSESADITSAASTAVETASTPHEAAQQQEQIMNVTLTRNDKTRKSNAVAYTATGYAGSVRFSKSFFADKTGPATLVLSDDSFAAARVARATMTPEERKAARANAPKLTPEQKLAKIEERAQKLREKIAKSAAAPAAQ